jgi:hypothetical protein
LNAVDAARPRGDVREPRWWRAVEYWALRPASVAIAAAWLVFGVRALRLDIRTAHVYAPKNIFPDVVLAQREIITNAVPPGEFVLHLSAQTENWMSRLWQRLLYPRNPTVVVQPPFGPAEIRNLRSRFGARFAISAGDPPYDPGYRWRIPFEPAPGELGQVWFGELAP